MGYLYQISTYTAHGRKESTSDEGTEIYVERESPKMCKRGGTFFASCHTGCPAHLEVIAGNEHGVTFRGSRAKWDEMHRPHDDNYDEEA